MGRKRRYSPSPTIRRPRTDYTAAEREVEIIRISYKKIIKSKSTQKATIEAK